MSTLNKLKTEYNQLFPDQPAVKTKEPEYQEVPRKFLGIQFGTKKVKITKTPLEELKEEYGRIFGSKEDAPVSKSVTSPLEKYIYPNRGAYDDPNSYNYFYDMQKEIQESQEKKIPYIKKDVKDIDLQNTWQETEKVSRTTPITKREIFREMIRPKHIWEDINTASEVWAASLVRGVSKTISEGSKLLSYAFQPLGKEEAIRWRESVDNFYKDIEDATSGPIDKQPEAAKASLIAYSIMETIGLWWAMGPIGKAATVKPTAAVTARVASKYPQMTSLTKTGQTLLRMIQNAPQMGFTGGMVGFTRELLNQSFDEEFSATSLMAETLTGTIYGTMLGGAKVMPTVPQSLTAGFVGGSFISAAETLIKNGQITKEDISKIVASGLTYSFLAILGRGPATTRAYEANLDASRAKYRFVQEYGQEAYNAITKLHAAEMTYAGESGRATDRSWKKILNTRTGETTTDQLRVIHSARSKVEAFFTKRIGVEYVIRDPATGKIITTPTKESTDLNKILTPQEKLAIQMIYEQTGSPSILSIKLLDPNPVVREAHIKDLDIISKLQIEFQATTPTSFKPLIPTTIPAINISDTLLDLSKIDKENLGKIEESKDITEEVEPTTPKEPEVTDIKNAIKKFDETGTADVITGKDFGITVKDEGEFISVRFGSNKLTPIGTVPSGARNFATKEEAFTFVKQLQERLAPKQIPTPKELELIAQKAKSVEEFKVGIGKKLDDLWKAIKDPNVGALEQDKLIKEQQTFVNVIKKEAEKRMTPEALKLKEGSQARIWAQRDAEEQFFQDFYNQAVKPTIPKELELSEVLRGTKGMTADDIMKTYPNIKLTRDVPAKDIYGNKITIDKGEKLTPYELKDGKILLQDGETYLVTKNQFDNIKGQSTVAEGKPFAPELEGLEETVKIDLAFKDWTDAEIKEHYKKIVSSEPTNKTIEEMKQEIIDFEGEIPDHAGAKFSQYQLPGGKDYREVLIKAPANEMTERRTQLDNLYKTGKISLEKYKEELQYANTGSSNFKSSHWDELNVIAWIRRKFYDYKNKKTYFLEELQSDWAREGRSKGFAVDKSKEIKALKDYESELRKKYDLKPKEGVLYATNKEEKLRYKKLEDATKTSNIPQHPLLKNWQELAIKRALKDAVANNSDYFSWISGEQTSARYNLATYIEKVEWFKQYPGMPNDTTKGIEINPKDKHRIALEIDNDGKITKTALSADRDWKGKKLNEVLGKGLADKIMEKPSGTLSGEGLKFGGEWATNLYDKQVPNIVKDLTGAEIIKMDMGLPIEAEKGVWAYTRNFDRVEDRLKPDEIKVGETIYHSQRVGGAQGFVITDILGGGKFKAVPKSRYETIQKLLKENKFPRHYDNNLYPTKESAKKSLEFSKQEFDISQKTTQQQGIKLTPEVKNKIKGIAPKIETSGKMFEPKTVKEVEPAEPTPKIVPVLQERVARPVEPEVKPKIERPRTEVKPLKQQSAQDAISKIIPKKPTVPVLGQFMVKDGVLHVTDLEIALKLKTNLEDGMYKLVGKDFIKTQTSMDEFPIIPEVKGDPIAQVPNNILAKELKAASQMVSKDPRRVELTGALIDIGNGEMAITSTNSFTLYYNTIPVSTSGKSKFILPHIQKISNLLGAIGDLSKVTVDEEMISFSGKYGELTVALMHGEFPTIKNIYPSFLIQYEFNRKQLINIIKDLKPFVDKINSFKLKLENDKITFTAKNEENLEKDAVLDVKKRTINTRKEVPTEGALIMPIKSEDKSPMFNFKYLDDIMKALDSDTLYFNLAEQEKLYSPALFTDHKYLSVETEPEVKPKEDKVDRVSKKPELETDMEEGSALFAKRWEVKMSEEPEISKTINKTEIMSWVEKTFKVPLKMKATHKWRASGMYYPKAQIVRMEKWGELSVLAHEVAHHIDTILRKTLGRNWYRPDRAITKELADLDYDQNKRRTEEGFAEYMRYRMTGDLAAEKAPNFHKYFDQFLKGNPELESNLSGMKKRFDIWHKQGAENRIIQHIDWKGEHTQIKGIAPKLKKALKFINEKFNDEFYVPQQIVKEIEKIRGRKLEPTKNPAIMMEYSKAKAGAIARTFIMDNAIDEYGNVVGPSLKKVLKPIPKKEMKQFIAYAVSKRALNLAGRNIESGFDIDDARFVIEKYKDKGWDETVKELTDWSNHLLDWVVRAGGLSDRAVKVIRDLNPIYLQFKRAFIDEVGVIKGVGGYVDAGGVIKGIKGSGRPIINPIEAMIAQSRVIISKAQKIRIAGAFADLSKEEGLGGFITEVPAPMRATTFDASQIEGYIEQVTGERWTIEQQEDFLTVFTQDFRYGGKENIVSLWRDGKQKFYEIHPELYEAFKGVDLMKLGPIIKMFAPFSRLLRLGATGLKLSFGLVRNPFRDAFSYAVFSKRNKVTIFDPIKGYYKNFATKPGETTWRFKKLGGALSGQIGLDRAATQHTYDELFNDRLGKMGKVLKVVRHPLDAFRDLLSVTEMGPRSVEIEKSYKKYLSPKWKKEHPTWTEEDAFIQAFIDAQDVTVNFTKSGKWAKQINQIAAFFNVAIRGPEKVYRSFRERPIATFVKGLIWLTLFAVAAWYRNKDKDWYKNLPPAYKYSNLFFEMPWGIIRLPIPFELGIIFMAAPQAALDTYRGDESAIQGFIDLAISQIPDPMPSAFGPLLDVKTNKNYLGVPIESEGLQYLYPTERKKSYTSNFAIALSRGMDKIGIKFSPIQLDYMIDSYSGGFFRQFRISGDELSDLPVLGDLMLRDPYYPRNQLNEYFADYEVLSQKKQSKIATKEELSELSKISGFYEYYRAIQKRIKKAKEAEDKDLLKSYYKQLTERLKKYGYD